MTATPEPTPQDCHPSQISKRKSLLPSHHASPNTPQISNREAFRLEIDVTPTKQTLDLGSNREETPLLSPPPISTAADGTGRANFSNRKSIQASSHVTPTKQTNTPQISNGEAFRLEIRLTPTKQRAGLDSNREETPLFHVPTISHASRGRSATGASAIGKPKGENPKLHRAGREPRPLREKSTAADAAWARPTNQYQYFVLAVNGSSG